MTLNVLTPGNIYAGDITDANLAQQMAVMNAAFAKAGVRHCGSWHCLPSFSVGL